MFEYRQKYNVLGIRDTKRLEYYIQLWSPQYGNDMDIIGDSLEVSHKVIRRMEHLSCEQRRREGCLA